MGAKSVVKYPLIGTASMCKTKTRLNKQCASGDEELLLLLVVGDFFGVTASKTIMY